MNHLSILLTLIITSLFVNGCSNMPNLVQWHDDEPAYEQGSAESAAAPSRAPLDVPPSLQGNVEVPDPGEIATNDGTMSPKNKKLVAGQAVGLDAKVYDQSASQVFSAVIDSMTALNMPVQSVDSPSGTVTTDWIRQSSAAANAASNALGNIFGGDGVQGVRYRFVVRVLRQKAEEQELTRLEIRTVGQAFINRHWVNRPIQRKVSEELFSAVAERLPK